LRGLDGARGRCLGFEAADPTGYGRLITSPDGALLAIREHKDATAAELEVRLCNSGVLAFRCPDLLGILDAIGSANAKGEYYLTDAVEIARARGLAASVVVCGAAWVSNCMISSRKYGYVPYDSRETTEAV
jgi:bifunctional UDP-N-acetylglucosamine pyrophosphorylase/glucosamine-1-phosphate N-acetyltransferase